MYRSFMTVCVRSLQTSIRLLTDVGLGDDGHLFDSSGNVGHS